MNIKEGKINNSQLMFLVASFMLGTSTFIHFMDTIAFHDSWLAILTAFVICIPFVLCYSALAKRFQGKDLIQINDIIYGSFLGKIISILYIVYFFLLLSLNLKGLGDFYVGYVMPETPKPVFIIIFALVCAYTVGHGLEPMARISHLTVTYAIFVITGTFLLLYSEVDFTNFLPIFELPIKDFIQSVHIVAAIPFCEVMVFLMVMPSLNNFGEVNKYMLLGFALGALCLLVISVRDTSVLGTSSFISNNAAYQTVRIIEIGEFFTRIEIVVAMGITICLFIKICVLYYITLASIAQLLKLKSYKTLIIPIGGIAIIIAFIAYDSIVSHNYSAKNYHVFYTIPYQFIIPPVSLLIAKLRRLPKRKGRELI
ncbi:GerAB/ArcD/ProY family transporter [Alkalibaculum sp. M08DMB]|uniref:GerAB/ArcD/ProY family transporter n=1 Tax=Alkalibaculum sporogenes TaxID=2655001 RepID=A0A6A7K7K6_9FIRM|nr:endospore germination permease [Alkalibaculum sporogenes]MPW25469.1 GerAB/ArcD/ProY family transporter [Alkalibaculum sporogenes]